MNITTIEMPQEQAKAAFQEYRHAVRSAKTAAANSEDAQIARAYKALAEGKQVVNIMDAFEQAGVDKLGLPRLAICRADSKIVTATHLTREGRTELISGAVPVLPWRRRSGALYEGELFAFPSVRLQTGNDITRYAIVPNIPPHLRPPHDLKNYHLLWEPEWLIKPRPPGDPMLLKHIGGPLYAVLAVWDLTEVEQAVLAITRGRS